MTPAKPMIYAKMSAVMKEIGAIGKDQKNTVQNFKFRGIDQFVNSLHPALTKHGVFMAPRGTSYTHELREVTRSNGKAGVDKLVSIMMEYTFYAEDGSSVTVGPIPAEGLDSGDKATNKALSAALKYALIQTFSVPTEDLVDGDSESPEIGSAKKSNGNGSNGKAATTTTSAATSDWEEDVATAPAPKESQAAAAAAAKAASTTAAKTETAASSKFRRKTKAAAPAATEAVDDGWGN